MQLNVYPESPELCLHIIQQANNSLSKGDGSKSGTFEIHSRYYFYHCLAQLVRRFVQKWEKYSRSKASNEKYNRFLHPQPMSIQAWKEVALNFFSGLPQVKNCNAICVIID